MRWLGWSSMLAALIVGGVAGFVPTNLGLASRSADSSDVREDRHQNGTEVLAIFVASSTCGASEYAGLAAAVRRIRSQLKHDAGQEGKRFVFMGIALDQDPMVGIEFLREFGPFDEIQSGGGWLNAGSISFIIRDYPARREVPQLILLERVVKVVDGSIEDLSDRLIGRRTGSDAIVAFADMLEGSGAHGSSKARQM